MVDRQHQQEGDEPSGADRCHGAAAAPAAASENVLVVGSSNSGAAVGGGNNSFSSLQQFGVPTSSSLQQLSPSAPTSPTTRQSPSSTRNTPPKTPPPTPTPPFPTAATVTTPLLLEQQRQRQIRQQQLDSPTTQSELYGSAVFEHNDGNGDRAASNSPGGDELPPPPPPVLASSVSAPVVVGGGTSTAGGGGKSGGGGGTSGRTKNVVHRVVGRPLRRVGRRLRFNNNNQQQQQQQQQQQGRGGRTSSSVSGGSGGGGGASNNNNNHRTAAAGYGSVATGGGSSKDRKHGSFRDDNGSCEEEEEGVEVTMDGDDGRRGCDGRGTNHLLDHFSPLIRRLSNTPKGNKAKGSGGRDNNRLGQSAMGTAAESSPSCDGGGGVDLEGGSDYGYRSDDEDDDDDSGWWGGRRRRSYICRDEDQHSWWVVSRLEAGLRSIALLLGAYLLGAYWHDPQIVHYAGKALEYSAVAWITCCVILLLVRSYSSAPSARGRRRRSSASSRRQRHYQRGRMSPRSFAAGERRETRVDEEEGVGTGGGSSVQRLVNSASPTQLGATRGAYASDRRLHYQQQQRREGNVVFAEIPPTSSAEDGGPVVVVQVDDLDEDANEEELLDEDSIGQLSSPQPSSDSHGLLEGAGSSFLDSLFIVDTATMTRIFPHQTVSKPYRLETEYFTGEMVIFVRTPDVDDDGDVAQQLAANDGNDDGAALVRSYLHDKQRRFEFQFQIRLKKVPTGRVYFGCELFETVKLGMIQRAFVGAAMAFVKTTNSNFSYSLTAAANNNNNNVPDQQGLDRPHMAFPVEEGMNRVVSTPPGEEPPALGKEIVEDEVSLKRRKKGYPIEWKMENIYTLSLWSAYVDFLDWRCMNLPGIRPFNLTNVIARQHINLTLYEVLPDSEKRMDICTIELSNSAKSRPGPAAMHWIQHYSVAEGPARTSPGALAGPSASSNDDASQSALLMPEEVCEDENFEEEQKIAELGEGIYIQSGDSITLRELLSSADELIDGSSYVTYAGGFAVLQEHSPATVIIEKVRGGNRSRSRNGSKLIKSGDTVVFRLVTSKNVRNNSVSETRYLSIHRGWWLKWVQSYPANNGHFTIFTHETECSDHGSAKNRGPSETQASYLTLGGSFYLRHRRWSKYQVGTAADVSATYGGRILGLYSRKIDDEEDFDDSDGEVAVQLVGSEKSRSEWLRPLQLRAYEPSADPMTLKASSEEAVAEEAVVEESKLIFNKDNLRLEVPAWVELMNRKDRVPQLAYVVRISPQSSEEMNDETEAFIRLRTGRQLSRITRMGLNWRNSLSTLPKKGMQSTPSLDRPAAMTQARRIHSEPSLSPQTRKRSSSFGELAGVSNSKDEGDENGSLPYWKDDNSSSSEEDWSDSGCDFDEDGGSAADPLASNRPKKGRKFIGKLAQSVKSKTKSTGKKVVQHSVKVGKGTVNASVKVGKGTVNVGKAIIATRPIKNPPSKYPPTNAPRRSRKQIEKDLHAAVSRSMRRMDKEEYRSPTVLAGELSATEQSCRTVSNMLTKMSSLPASSGMTDQISRLLASELISKSEQEDWFLCGGAIQLGVIPTDASGKKGKMTNDCLVARCLWESHWREEVCGLYEDTLAFYAPHTGSPCLELSFVDIQAVRNLGANCLNPLPGYPILIVETSWMCHYMAFKDTEKRDNFRIKIDEALVRASAQKELSGSKESSLWRARFWQGFETSLNSTVSSGKGKWADVLSGSKMRSRLILNNRRMVFDIPEEPENPAEFVEELLETSLSFSHLAHLNEHPEALVKFLDATSQLQRLRLHSVDLSSSVGFCLFVNLYHTLLQHALLLTVNGPLNRRSFGHFMKTSCYEIGGDVFSLAELNCCVIRGNMSRPISTKAPAVDAPKKSDSYRFYALGYTTPKVNFLLNTGDIACPREVPVLTPSQLDAQLNIQTSEYLRLSVEVDFNKKLVYLPKICEVYRNDFAPDAVGAANMCLRYCLSFLDDDDADAIKAVFEDSSAFIKYRKPEDQFHTTLRMRNYYTDEGFEVPIQL